MKVTILTATYNRCNLLPKLYESIVENYKTFKDLEWIIMDDGSLDDTKKIVDKWIKKSEFKIEYHYQENQGKMRAINNGLEYVTGDIVIEIDSDDYLMPDVLGMISDDYEKLGKKNVYGIAYKRKLIGKDNTVEGLNNKIVKLFDIHNKYEYDFDMALTFKASVRKKDKYPLEYDEKFVTEARLYYKWDQEYDGLLFKDKEIIISEYMEDGYSKNINKMFKQCPHGYYNFFKECLSYSNKDNTTKHKKLYFIKHYILFSYLTHKKMRECIKGVKGVNKLLVTLLVIPGYIKSSRF